MGLRRATFYTFIAIILAICELCFAKYIAIGAGVPMFLFCFVILASMNEPEREYALILGLLLGALYDLILGHGFGTYTVLFGLTAWETASLCDSVLSSRVLFLIINTIIMTIFAQCVFFLVNITGIGADTFSHGFLNIILPTALYNTAICLIFYRYVSVMIAKRR